MPIAPTVPHPSPNPVPTHEEAPAADSSASDADPSNLDGIVPSSLSHIPRGDLHATMREDLLIVIVMNMTLLISSHILIYPTLMEHSLYR